MGNRNRGLVCLIPKKLRVDYWKAKINWKENELRYHNLKTLWEKLNATTVSDLERRVRYGISGKAVLGPALDLLLLPWVWITGRQQSSHLWPCLHLPKSCRRLRDIHDLQKWKDLSKLFWWSTFCASVAASETRLGRQAERSMGSCRPWKITATPE